jgi:hypothetical protein
MSTLTKAIPSPPVALRLTLSRFEWDLIWDLRAIPPGAARDELQALLKDTVALVGEPTCFEAQADGIPCGSADAECAGCRRVRDGLVRLRQALAGG